LIITNIKCFGASIRVLSLSLLFLFGSCDKVDIPEDGLEKRIVGAWKMNTLVSKIYQNKGGQLIHNLVNDTLFLYSFDEFGRYYDTLLNVKADTIKRAFKGTWEIGGSKLTLRDTLNSQFVYNLGISTNNQMQLNYDSTYSRPKIFEYKQVKYNHTFVSHKLTGSLQTVR